MYIIMSPFTENTIGSFPKDLQSIVTSKKREILNTQGEDLLFY